MPNLRVYGAVDAVHLGDEHLHVHEPLDGSDDGGDDAHGFVGSYRDAAHVTWTWHCCDDTSSYTELNVDILKSLWSFKYNE